MFQCGTSVAESCSALNQKWVLDMNSKTVQIMHFNIELEMTFTFQVTVKFGLCLLRLFAIFGNFGAFRPFGTCETFFISGI